MPWNECQLKAFEVLCSAAVIISIALFAAMLAVSPVNIEFNGKFDIGSSVLYPYSQYDSGSKISGVNGDVTVKISAPAYMVSPASIEAYKKVLQR